MKWNKRSWMNSQSPWLMPHGSQHLAFLPFDFRWSRPSVQWTKMTQSKDTTSTIGWSQRCWTIPISPSKTTKVAKNRPRRGNPSFVRMNISWSRLKNCCGFWVLLEDVVEEYSPPSPDVKTSGHQLLLTPPWFLRQTKWMRAKWLFLRVIS